MVLARCCFPQSVKGGGFLKPIPLKPQTPVRSFGLNACPSTLYLALSSTLSLLFWQRGHCFHPGGYSKEPGAWARPATEKTSVAINAPIETMICFRMVLLYQNAHLTFNFPSCRTGSVFFVLEYTEVSCWNAKQLLFYFS